MRSTTSAADAADDALVKLPGASHGKAAQPLSRWDEPEDYTNKTTLMLMLERGNEEAAIGLLGLSLDEQPVADLRPEDERE